MVCAGSLITDPWNLSRGISPFDVCHHSPDDFEGIHDFGAARSAVRGEHLPVGQRRLSSSSRLTADCLATYARCPTARQRGSEKPRQNDTFAPAFLRAGAGCAWRRTTSMLQCKTDVRGVDFVGQNHHHSLSIRSGPIIRARQPSRGRRYGALSRKARCAGREGPETKSPTCAAAI